MSKKPFALWTDQDVCDWFDNLDDDYIRSLIDLHDDHDITPRKAFHYVFGDLDSQHCTCQACRLSLSPVPAQERQSESVAAPAEVGQGQGTSFQLEAAQTALICVRQALLISQTTEDQCACMAAFAAQAQRVMQLSGRGASV